MPIRGPIFESILCAAIAVAGIGCTKAAFDAPDAGAPVCSVPPEACSTESAAVCAQCALKCSYVATSGGDAIQATCAAKGDSAAFSECDSYFEGTPSQTDTCETGSVCLRPRGEDRKFCFPLCTSSTYCPGGVECGQRSLFPGGPSVNVCDPEYVQVGSPTGSCDPLAGKGCSGGRYCLLVPSADSTGRSRTVCEYSIGNGRDDPPSACNSPRDCFLQFTCVGGLCKQVCQAKTTCYSGRSCVELGSDYGYCP